MEKSTNDELDEHERFMRRCIELAHVAKSNGESPVGSLLVRNGEIIGEGIEASKAHLDITFHAEMEAIRNATKFLDSQDLSGCILYTTHEPCIMCSYMIRHTKIQTIISSIKTGEYGGFSSKYPLLLHTSIPKWGNAPVIINGILEDECRGLS